MRWKGAGEGAGEEGERGRPRREEKLHYRLSESTRQDERIPLN